MKGQNRLPYFDKGLIQLRSRLRHERTYEASRYMRWGGGQGLYEALDNQFQDLQFILDYYHFREHLYATAVEISLQGDAKEKWIAEKSNLAWEGQVEKLINALEAEYDKTQINKIRQLKAYLERFNKCIDYKRFKEVDFSIGSGKPESAHKYITQKRLKQPGTWWLVKNVNPMLSLRIIKSNAWWKNTGEVLAA